MIVVCLSIPSLCSLSGLAELVDGNEETEGQYTWCDFGGGIWSQTWKGTRKADQQLA